MNKIETSELKEIINNFNKKEEIVYYKIDGLFKVFLQADTLNNEVKKIYSQNCKINYYITGEIAYMYSGIAARYLAKRDIKVINFIESKVLDINFLDKQYFYIRYKKGNTFRLEYV